MELYLAPMEGVTGFVIRNAVNKNFKCIDKFFTPFIPAQKRLSQKILKDLAPENNEGMYLVPQLISNSSEEILEMIQILKDLGFNEFNLNLGCPSKTVVGKKRGSGMLTDLEMLDNFLGEIYEKADVPVSVKTRIGFYETEEWPEILKIYKKYPISELIIHPRIQKEMYKGRPHLDAFKLAYDKLGPKKLIYNGDIWNKEDYEKIKKEFPDLKAIMMGRGLLSDPEILNGISATNGKSSNFFSDAFNGYKGTMSEKDAMMHMKEIFAFRKMSHPEEEKLIKKILKCNSVSEYDVLVKALNLN